MTALLEEAALFVPGCDMSAIPPVAPSDSDRLVMGYRLIGGPPLYRTIFNVRGGQSRGHIPVCSRIWVP